ncbi:SOS response-associated peptidase family protein [Mesorhizobium mediterraneum]|uniref:SOS response-associated peptidase family protein n=1 Tax=Mesorhizobium mediterraneum TaxID=43617 RepID=UPI00177DBBB0|nr:SOS response-associated peptidase [Mesorhizobium mediterraneum]
MFDVDAPLDQRRVIIRRGVDGVEMVELRWGLRPSEAGSKPFTLIRSEERRFPSHRCLVPASEFRFGRGNRRYRVVLADRDWFYFAGIWRTASQDWPEAYAILTVDSNPDVAPYQERQMVVLRREQRTQWLDLSHPEPELLRPLPAGTFRIERLSATEPAQGVLAV